MWLYVLTVFIYANGTDESNKNQNYCYYQIYLQNMDEQPFCTTKMDPRSVKDQLEKGFVGLLGLFFLP